MIQTDYMHILFYNHKVLLPATVVLHFFYGSVYFKIDEKWNEVFKI